MDRLILEDHPEHCIPETAKEGEEEIAPLKGGNRQVIMSMEKTDKGTEKTKPIGVGILFAVLAAALYAINSPTSKLLLGYMPSTLMAGFLYIGAGIGMLPVALFRKCGTKTVETKLTRKELPYTVAMILLDIAAPICLLLGLKSATAANASLLNNFEIVATAVIALVVFREKISVRLWFGILFVTLSCVLLSFEDVSGLRFSIGSLLILVACVCWGLENNCTRKISSKDPLQIVLLKGIFSGTGSLVIGLLAGERVRVLWSVFAVLGVGFVAYGLSIFFLCVCAENSRRRPHERVLCHSAFYRDIFVFADFQGNVAVYLFYSFGSDGGRRVAGVGGQTAVPPASAFDRRNGKAIPGISGGFRRPSPGGETIRI